MLHVSNFKLETVFPDDICEAIIEVQARIQAPMWLVVLEFLSAMAVAAQGLYDVCLPTGQRCPLSLFLLVVGETGERKSAVFKLAHAAIIAFEKSQDEKYRRDKAKVNSVDEPRDLLIQDATWKAILEALEGEGHSVAINIEEGSRVLKSPLMNQLGGLADLWGGAHKLSMHRSGHERLCAFEGRLTMSLAVQPDVLATRLARDKDARGLGFWARFLVAYPASTQGTRFGSHSVYPASLDRFYEKTRLMLERRYQALNAGDPRRSELMFSTEAKALWFQIAYEIERKINTEYQRIRDFANKAAEITARVSALMHCFGDESAEITCQTLLNAWQLVQQHMFEFHKIFNPPPAPPQEYEDAKKILNCLDRHGVYELHPDDLRALSELSVARFRAGLFVLKRDRMVVAIGQRKNSLVRRVPYFVSENFVRVGYSQINQAHFSAYPQMLMLRENE